MLKGLGSIEKNLELSCDLSRVCNSFCFYSENTDHVNDVNRNSSSHESQSSEKKLCVAKTDEPGPINRPQTENMNDKPNEVHGTNSGRDLGEEIREDNDIDIALNIGNEGHVKSIIAKFS